MDATTVQQCVPWKRCMSKMRHLQGRSTEQRMAGARGWMGLHLHAACPCGSCARSYVTATSRLEKATPLVEGGPNEPPCTSGEGPAYKGLRSLKGQGARRRWTLPKEGGRGPGPSSCWVIIGAELGSLRDRNCPYLNAPTVRAHT